MSGKNQPIETAAGRVDGSIRLRKNVTSLSAEEVDLLKKAFRGIKSKSYKDPQSFFTLASWHGAGANVCAHHVQLFLPWHRRYVHLFEDALRSIPGCASVTLPFWDATGQSVEIPTWFSQDPFDKFDLKAAFPSQDEWNRVWTAFKDQFVSRHPVKPFEPTTNRDPDFPNGTIDTLSRGHVYDSANSAMSQGLWDYITNSQETFDGTEATDRGIEHPHDDIHGAVGGWMGNPYLAAFDPIFWFHHSNVERLFKTWQEQNNATTKAGLDATCQDFQIPWDDQFRTKDANNSLADTLPSFTGTFVDNIWQPDVVYEAGSFSKAAANGPQNIMLASFAAHAPQAKVVKTSKAATGGNAHNSAAHASVASAGARNAAPTAAVAAASSTSSVPTSGVAAHNHAHHVFDNPRTATQSDTVVVSNRLSIRVKHIDRSHIKGSFFVRVFLGESKQFDIIAFQKGAGCTNCDGSKLFAVSSTFPAEWLKPNDHVRIKLIQKDLQGNVASELTNFGKPRVNIRHILTPLVASQ